MTSPRLKPSKVIIFDVYKTLIDIQNNEEQQQTYSFISNWLSYKGIHIEPQIIYGLYKEFSKDEVVSNTEPYPDIDVAGVFGRLICEVVDSPKDVLDEIVKEMGALFRLLTTTSLTIFPETTLILDALSNKYRLGIASNSQRIFTLPELKKFGLTTYFESIVFSSDVGACKPNPKIFRKVLNDMGVNPQDAIFIGDNLFDDVWGAQQLGMMTVWIDHGTKVRFPEDIKKPVPDLQIQRYMVQYLPDMLL